MARLTKENSLIDQLDVDGDIYTVETWFDHNTSNWITQTLSPSRWQIGDATFAHYMKTAKIMHDLHLNDAPQAIRQFRVERTSDQSQWETPILRIPRSETK